MKEQNRYGYSTKLNFALLGNSGVGKTCIIQQYCKQEYKNTTMTCCIDFAKKQFEDFVLYVFDTAGSERYRSLATSYLKNQQAIIIVYDVTDLKSKTEIHNWRNIAQQVKPNAPIIIMANKIDLLSKSQLQNLQQQEQQISSNSSIKTFFTSALLNEGIEDAFNYLINLTKDQVDDSLIKSHNSQRRFNNKNTNNTQRCEDNSCTC